MQYIQRILRVGVCSPVVDQWHSTGAQARCVLGSTSGLFTFLFFLPTGGGVNQIGESEEKLSDFEPQRKLIFACPRNFTAFVN